MRGANFIKGLREINQSLTSAAGKMAISARRRDLFNTINIRVQAENKKNT